MDEEWKDVTGYEGLYKVSNFGNVYSNYIHRNLKPGNHKDGYKFVILNKNGDGKYKLVHRLVADAFIPNPNNLPEINHKDQTPSNNNVNNLEWCDFVYNATYNDVHIKRGEQLSKTVYAYNKNGNLVGTYASTHKIADYFDMSDSNVSAACNSTYRTFNGLILSYQELSKQEVLDRFKLNKKRKSISQNIGSRIKEIKSKPVNQYDLDGNFIQSFPSTQEAGRKLGFSSSLIAGVCRGEHKYTHGYIFRYV